MKNKIIDKNGYLDSNKANHTPYKIIPSNNITMKGVSQTIIAIPYKNGKPLGRYEMKPGQDYDFGDVDYVMEIPKGSDTQMLKGQLGVNSSDTSSLNTPSLGKTNSFGIDINTNMLDPGFDLNPENLRLTKNKLGDYSAIEQPTITGLNSDGNYLSQGFINNVNDRLKSTNGEKILPDLVEDEAQLGEDYNLDKFLKKESVSPLPDLVEDEAQLGEGYNLGKFSQKESVSPLPDLVEDEEFLEQEKLDNLDNFVQELEDEGILKKEKQKKPESSIITDSKTQFYNPYGGFDLQTSLFNFGRATKNKKAGDAIGFGLLSGLKAARPFLAGRGQQKRDDYLENWYNSKQGQGLRGDYTRGNAGNMAIGKYGGEILNYQEGGDFTASEPQTQSQQAQPQQQVALPQISEADILKSIEILQGRQSDILKDTGYDLDTMISKIGKPNKKETQHNKNLISEFEANYLSVLEGSQMLGQSVPPFDIEDLEKKTPTKKTTEKKHVKEEPKTYNESGRKNYQIRRNLMWNNNGILNPEHSNNSVGGMNYMQDGGQISNAQAITGEVTQGIPQDTSAYSQAANAELEAGEYLQNSDGSVQRVVGKKHTGGGEKFKLENGDRVISDHLKVGKKNAKELSKQYEIKVKATDTYSTVIDKYNSKIGLNRINKEMEGYIKDLEKLTKNADEKSDETTFKINLDFISEKIYNVQQAKVPLERLRTLLTDDVYEKQEKSKDTVAYRKSQEKENNYKHGGSIKDGQIEALCKKHGIPYDRGVQLMKQYQDGGEILNYKKGGEVKSNMPKYENGKEVENITTSDTAGTEFEGANTPAAARQRFINNIDSYIAAADKSEVFSFLNKDELQRIKSSVEANKEVDVRLVNDYAKKVQEQIHNNPTISREFSKITVPTVQGLNFMGQDEAFLKSGLLSEEEISRLSDPKGTRTHQNAESDSQFISGIRDKYFQHLKKDNTDAENFDMASRAFSDANFKDSKFDFRLPQFEVKMFEDKISHDKWVKEQEELGNMIIKDGKKMISSTGDGVFITPTYKGMPEKGSMTTPEGVAETPATTDKEKEEEVNELEPFNLISEGKNMKAFNTPIQFIPPPRPLDAHLKTDIDLGRLDPTRVSERPTLNAINEQVAAALESVNKYGDANRKNAEISAITGAAQAAAQAATTIAAQNAQIDNKTEMFNIGQADRETTGEQNAALDFERRQLTAKAKTEADVDDYFTALNDVRLGNYNMIQKLNMMNQLYDNFQIDENGNLKMIKGNNEVKIAPSVTNPPLNKSATT